MRGTQSSNINFTELKCFKNSSHISGAYFMIITETKKKGNSHFFPMVHIS